MPWLHLYLEKDPLYWWIQINIRQGAIKVNGTETVMIQVGMMEVWNRAIAGGWGKWGLARRDRPEIEFLEHGKWLIVKLEPKKEEKGITPKLSVCSELKHNRYRVYMW